MNKVKLSTGELINRSTFDNRIKKAKDDFTHTFLDEFGHYYCQQCGQNEQGCPGIARAHIISVKQCIENPKIPAELAYNPIDFEMMGQACHTKFDSQTNQDRLQYFIQKTNFIFE